jgi:similar to stage IV sporulation protein
MQAGTIVITCSGAGIASLLNEMVQAKVVLRDVHWINKELVHITVSITDLHTVRKAMQKQRVRGRIVKKSGLYFWCKKIKKRKFFVVGFAFFLCLLFFFSSFVWHVDIEGEKQIPEKDIRAILHKEGIYPGQLKVSLPASDVLQRKLLKQIPHVSWVGVRIEGTRVIVTVAEKKRIDTINEKKLIRRPVHLIAKKNAFIVDVRVSHGHPVVQVNDMVKKGQLLVSGTYGETPDSGKIVGAQGIVLGEVWYESEVVVPLTKVQKEYTGDRQRYTWPFLGSFVWSNPFHSPKPYAQFEQTRRIVAVQLGKYKLPFGIVHDDYWAVRQVKQQLKPIEAIALGRKQARMEMIQTIGEEGRILTEKILHQRVDNGKVYLKIHFDVVENISQEKPILQGD